MGRIRLPPRAIICSANTLPDEEKKKYFKIQETSPAGSAYSSQDVKRRKLRDEKNVQRVEAEARRQGRIRRAEAFNATLAGHIFQREIRQCRRYRLDGARIYSHGLLPRGRLSPIVNGSPLFALNHRPDLGPSKLDIKLVLNDQLLTTRINTERSVVPGQLGGFENCHKSQNLLPLSRSSWLLEVFGNSGPATSLTMHIDSGAMAMTWLSGSSNSGIAVIPKPSGDSYTPEPSLEAPTVVLGPGVEKGPQADIFSSTPAPTESPLAFAFGSNYGILSLDKEYGHLSWVKSGRFPGHKIPKDVFALEFLADNHNVLLSGCRKGILNITDLRKPRTESGIINHPSSITHIRQLDKNRIIVAGLNSNLCQYDLRFWKETTTIASTRQRNKSFHNATVTCPVLQYPDFHNDSSIQMGFDVDLETGTVAAAQEMDEFNPPVRLFSMHGGQEETPLDMPTDFRNGGNIGCIKFFEDIQGRVKSLYVGGRFVQRFAWTEFEEDDP